MVQSKLSTLGNTARISQHGFHLSLEQSSGFLAGPTFAVETFAATPERGKRYERRRPAFRVPVLPRMVPPTP
jgi:hypothetical protein